MKYIKTMYDESWESLDRFGTLLEEIRKDKPLTQIAVSKMLHISKSHYSRWERNEAIPKLLEDVEAICIALQCTDIDRARLFRAYAVDVLLERGFE